MTQKNGAKTAVAPTAVYRNRERHATEKRVHLGAPSAPERMHAAEAASRVRTSGKLGSKTRKKTGEGGRPTTREPEPALLSGESRARSTEKRRGCSEIAGASLKSASIQCTVKPALTNCDAGDKAQNTSECGRPGKGHKTEARRQKRRSAWGRPTTKEPSLRSTQARTT